MLHETRFVARSQCAEHDAQPERYSNPFTATTTGRWSVLSQNFVSMQDTATRNKHSVAVIPANAPTSNLQSFRLKNHLHEENEISPVFFFIVPILSSSALFPLTIEDLTSPSMRHEVARKRSTVASYKQRPLQPTKRRTYSESTSDET